MRDDNDECGYEQERQRLWESLAYQQWLTDEERRLAEERKREEATDAMDEYPW